MSNHETTFWEKNKDEITLKSQFDTWLEERPGFFKRYQNTNDFIETITEPVTISLKHGFISTFIAASSVAIAAFCIGSFIFGAAAKVCGNSGLGNSSFTLAAYSAQLAGISLLQSLILAISAVLSVPIVLFNIAARTATSIIGPIADCFSGNESTAQVSL